MVILITQELITQEDCYFNRMMHFSKDSFPGIVNCSAKPWGIINKTLFLEREKEMILFPTCRSARRSPQLNLLTNDDWSQSIAKE